MSKISIFFGLLLITLGLVFYVATGSSEFTALIPSFVGGIIVVLGLVALVPRYRKHAAHVAALFGLLGFLAGIGRGAMTLTKEGGSMAAGIEQILMGIICLVYLVFCVKSFISARKAMKAEAAANLSPPPAAPAVESSPDNTGTPES